MEIDATRLSQCGRAQATSASADSPPIGKWRRSQGPFGTRAATKVGIRPPQAGTVTIVASQHAALSLQRRRAPERSPIRNGTGGLGGRVFLYRAETACNTAGSPRRGGRDAQGGPLFLASFWKGWRAVILARRG